MTKTTKAFQFRRLLPLIYFKIIKEGYKHDECAKWLRDNEYLDISTAMFTTYLNRHGNVEKETLKYNQYLEDNNPEWFEENANPENTTIQDLKHSEWYGKDFERNHYQNNQTNINDSKKPIKNDEETTIKSNISKLVHSQLGPSPSDNQYKNTEHPMEALRRKKKMSNIPPILKDIKGG